MRLIRSRVLDTRKAITSRTGRDRAVKARETLATAQSICRGDMPPRVLQDRGTDNHAYLRKHIAESDTPLQDSVTDFRMSERWRNVVAMPDCDLNLFWREKYLGTALARKGIKDRSTLARKAGLPPSTVHQNFDADWSGRVVSISVLVALCRFLNADLHHLVYEPRNRAARAAR